MAGLVIALSLAISWAGAEDSGPPAETLLLKQIPLADQGWLHVRGLLELRRPELGPESPVFNPRTGLDLTQAEIERLRLRPTAAEAGPIPGPYRRPRSALETLSMQELKLFGSNPRSSVPLGPLPSGDYAGSMRGPSLAAEGVKVLEPNAARLDVSLTAANYLNNESEKSGVVRQKFETQTLDAQLRVGLNFPRPVEAGLQVRLHRQNQGILNGFIDNVEHLAAAISGNSEMINLDRSGPKAMSGYVNRVRLGREVIQDGGISGPRLGDVTVTVKAALRDQLIGSPIPALSARLAATIATGAYFSPASSVAAGLSAQEKLNTKTYLHADIRAVKPIGSADQNGVPFRPVAMGATVGVERLVGPATSLGVQVNYQGTPYKRTGVHAFDDAYADVTFGVSHAAKFLAREVVIRIYGKEDFNVNANNRNRLAPHGDSDFKAGISVSVPIN